MLFAARSAAARVLVCLLSLLAGTPQSVCALSFIGFDARSMALGGTGIVTAPPGTAAYFNPALLQRPLTPSGPDHFAQSHLGARLIDRDRFIDGLIDFQAHDNDEAVTAAIDRLNLDVADRFPVAQDLRDLADSAEALLRDLEGLSDKPLRAGVTGGLAIGRTGTTGFAAFSRRFAIAGGVIRFAAQDRLLASQLIAFSRTLADSASLIEPYANLLDEQSEALQDALDAGGTSGLQQALAALSRDTELEPNVAELQTLAAAYADLHTQAGNVLELVEQFKSAPDAAATLESGLELRGALVTESGVSVARDIDSRIPLSVGASLKSVRFEPVDYFARVAEAKRSNFDFNASKRSYTDFNADLGVSVFPARRWQAALVVRNLIPRDYATVRGNRIGLRPLVRVGIAYSSPDWLLAADLDVTRNEPLGFDPDKRYLSMGAEWRAPSNLRPRVGVRHNLIDAKPLFSAGLGWQARHLSMDLALASAGDEHGVALQFEWYF